MVAEGAHNGGPVLPDGLRPRLGRVVLHEGKVGRLLALRLRVEHPGKAQLRVKPAQEAVEGRGRGFGGAGIRRRGGRVHRDGRVTGGRLGGNARRVRVQVRSGVVAGF